MLSKLGGRTSLHLGRRIYRCVCPTPTWTSTQHGTKEHQFAHTQTHTQPSEAAVTVDQSHSRSKKRLGKLRQNLAQGPELGDFVSLDAHSIRRTDWSQVKEKDPPKPSWLRVSSPVGGKDSNYHKLQKDVRSLNLATVCEEAKCPNIGDCWGGNETETATATIMLMGDTCTRGCNFCAVKTAREPAPLDPNEPENVAEGVSRWGVDYIVLTSVDRDDLKDQGADHFARTVEKLKEKCPELLVECLTPDFSGKAERINRVVDSGLDVFAHNLETVERMTPRVRDRRATYSQSLKVLEMAKQRRESMLTKTSLMLGVGETDEEVRQTMRECRDAGVNVITFGQYLRPTKRHLPVQEYVHPDKFEQWRQEGEDMGFLYVASGPLVRSSYKAGEYYLKGVLRRQEEGAKVLNDSIRENSDGQQRQQFV